MQVAAEAAYLNQTRTIEALYHWLQANRWSDSLTVRCDHVTEARETLSLFLGTKRPREGRSNWIAQVDILVCNEDTQTVELVIEVDPNPNPKKLLGDVLAVLIADNYTPSNNYSPYKIDGALVVFVTALDGRAESQKVRQFERIEEALNTKLDLSELGVRAVRLCYGRTGENAVKRCSEIIRREFLHPESSNEGANSPSRIPMQINGGARKLDPSRMPGAPFKVKLGDQVEVSKLYVTKSEAQLLLREKMSQAGIPLHSKTARCMFEATKDSRGGNNCKLGRTPLWDNHLRVADGKVLRSEFMDWVERLIESGHKFQNAGRSSQR